VFKTYGEERFAKRIARAICDYRKDKEITRTLQLAEIVAKANPKWEKHKNPATRVFQAIRIHVNNELEVLERALQQCLDILKPGGHLVVISFHSLEDRIVKRFFKEQAQGRPLPKGLPVKENFIDRKVKLISKAIKAGEAELDVNPRARSAVLRAVEKLK
jgi:16S rRNA (cytosine1402-N4)-methyltransferase